MDLNEFWQENKRWVQACLGGLLVFWMAWMIISNVYDSGTSRTAKAIRVIRDDDLYRRAAKDAVEQESEVLQASLQELRQAMDFVVAPEFSLQGKGDPELHWIRMESQTRDALLAQAGILGVALSEESFQWQAPVGREAIARQCIGLNLVQEALQRLYAAHETVRSQEPQALGLRAIQQCRMANAKGERRRRTGSRGRQQSQSLTEEVVVNLNMQLDYATLRQFLESCRSQEPPISLRSLKVQQGDRSGDPLLVQCQLLALLVQAPTGAATE